MTGNPASYTAKDCVLGLVAMMLVFAIIIPVTLGILRATAPYGWNHVVMPAAMVVCSLLSLASSRRSS